MIAAARLFIIMGLFGITADVLYYVWSGQHKEYAGGVMLGAFFLACVFVGLVLRSVSPANKRRLPAPDTGLPGSASQKRGAADEHGNVHVFPNSPAPVIYSLAATILLFAIVYRDKAFGPWGVAVGLLLFLVATAIWYRAASAQAATAGGHGAGHGGLAVQPAREPLAVPAEPPGPGNYLEQLREAFEAGDADWAAAAYAPDAVYYEPANPPHVGRESIRAYLEGFLQGHPGLQYSVLRMGSSDTVAIAEWTWSFRRGGRRISNQPGATVIEIGPQGIAYHRDYF